MTLKMESLCFGNATLNIKENYAAPWIAAAFMKVGICVKVILAWEADFFQTVRDLHSLLWRLCTHMFFSEFPVGMSWDPWDTRVSKRNWSQDDSISTSERRQRQGGKIQYSFQKQSKEPRQIFPHWREYFQLPAEALSFFTGAVKTPYPAGNCCLF